MRNPFTFDTDLSDLADNFMAEDERQFRIRQFAIDDMEIGAADRARRHPHEHLTGGRVRRWHLRAFERSTRRLEKHRAHIKKGPALITASLESNASCCRNFPSAA